MTFHEWSMYCHKKLGGGCGSSQSPCYETMCVRIDDFNDREARAEMERMVDEERIAKNEQRGG